MQPPARARARDGPCGRRGGAVCTGNAPPPPPFATNDVPGGVFGACETGADSGVAGIGPGARTGQGRLRSSTGYRGAEGGGAGVLGCQGGQGSSKACSCPGSPTPPDRGTWLTGDGPQAGLFLRVVGGWRVGLRGGVEPPSPELHWKGGCATPPPSRAPSVRPATVSLTPSAGFNGICNRQ